MKYKNQLKKYALKKKKQELGLVGDTCVQH